MVVVGGFATLVATMLILVFAVDWRNEMPAYAGMTNTATSRAYSVSDAPLSERLPKRTLNLAR